MPREDRFDLPGQDRLAARSDNILGPATKPEASPVVPESEVGAQKPSVVVAATAAAFVAVVVAVVVVEDDARIRRRSALPIPVHYVGSARRNESESKGLHDGLEFCFRKRGIIVAAFAAAAAVVVTGVDQDLDVIRGLANAVPTHGFSGVVGALIGVGVGVGVGVALVVVVVLAEREKGHARRGFGTGIGLGNSGIWKDVLESLDHSEGCRLSPYQHAAGIRVLFFSSRRRC
mmetsp:Transcript_15506/g.42987  ORF Transcript_15506/g.42987 Transcript_15506/m.42987 type:complete len:232 (-) Transcript_15506:373-1068(-)